MMVTYDCFIVYFYGAVSRKILIQLIQMKQQNWFSSATAAFGVQFCSRKYINVNCFDFAYNHH
jgi:hypothetical protein